MLEVYWKRLVRLGFHLLYNELAWSYDAVSWLVSMGSWRAWQRVALPFVMGKCILEVGHGPGHMLKELSEAGYQTIGLDQSRHMGRIAQKRVSTPLVHGRVQELPFATASFDTVFSTFPTEYVVDPESLASVHRVLQPNGFFVIVPEGHLTGTMPWHRFIEWLFRITGQRQWPFAIKETRQWPRQDQWNLLQQLFIDNGFVTHLEQIQLPRSAVTILIARKS